MRTYSHVEFPSTRLDSSRTDRLPCPPLTGQKVPPRQTLPGMPQAITQVIRP
jgi:hypothetical protein